jgi:two-component system alkaline phosphatase synthesis response regulator PhoP
MVRRKRVLVVDDDITVRTVIKNVLEQAGFEVEPTADFGSAAEDAAAGRYDLITLDLRMPTIDGREVARLLQKQNVGTPVLMISGHLDRGAVDELRGLGIRHFLLKPFGMAELLEAVESALSGTEGKGT